MTTEPRWSTSGVLLAAVVVLLIGGAAACTTLGPMPATTGVVATPAGRPSGEVGFGVVPGYYLSSGTQSSPAGSGLTQASLLIEPDRVLKLPGLVLGARHVGSGKNGGYFEPLAGYRCHLDDGERISAVAVGYFTRASGGDNGASYEATRGGAEVGFDVLVTPRSRWFEVHGTAAAALTGLSVQGRYCLDPTAQFGDSCTDPAIPARMTNVSASGLYPSGTAGVSVDFGRHLSSVFHGGRFSLLVSTGTMPTAIAGQQRSAHWYGAAGATLSLGFGSVR